MQITLDTSALVRFCTNDVPSKALLVKKLLDSDLAITIPDAVFPELEYVLLKTYNSNRVVLIIIYQYLTSHLNITTSAICKKATIIYEHSSLDMADCMIAAASLNGELASFDKKLLKLSSVRSYWKE